MADQTERFQGPFGLSSEQGLRLAGRSALSLAIAAGFLWLLADRIAQIDRPALIAAFGQLSLAQWALALGFTGVSFWAVGRYDAVLHRHFCTGLPDRATRLAGVCAISVSQTLGLGLITGAILRWRMLPNLSLWQATRLTAAVALSFLGGWAVVTASVLILVPAAPFKPLAALVLVFAVVGVALCLVAPNLPGLRFRWPNGFTLSRLFGLCAVDTLAAAAAFAALCPPELGLTFFALLAPFLLAFGAGLIMGTPGGMGAFEVALLALLPGAAPAPLFAAILGWRAVYYALPAVLGAGRAALGPTAFSDTSPPDQSPLPDLPAEFGLAAQNRLQLARHPGAVWLVGRSNHMLLSLLGPVAKGRAAIALALQGFEKIAEREARLAAHYKLNPRQAAVARSNGLTLRRIGWEAWVSPTQDRLQASCRAGLRRKLRRAEAAGVAVRLCPAETAPWPALTALAADWAKAHGGERGFSMGRFSRPYLAGQRLYIAWQNGQPIAFASFHTGPNDWALDLMRHGACLPDGTMHSLIQAAIDDARRAGIRQVSLAAVPEGAMGQGDLITRLIAVIAPETASDGLRRFKGSFAPHWRPLYLAAPTRLGLLLAGFALWLAITRPPPMMSEIERDDAEYGFASVPAAWHIARNED